MSKPYPTLYKDCKHSKPSKDAEWNLLCQHPVVNAGDPWALARASISSAGSGCRDERQRKWLAPCGMRGKLWEPSENVGATECATHPEAVVGRPNAKLTGQGGA